MAWTCNVDLDADKTTDGNSVGAVTGTYTDASLFAEPFSVPARWNFKADFSTIAKLFKDALVAETTRRTVAAKVRGAIEAELNK